jgi:hypothetical protein
MATLALAGIGALGSLFGGLFGGSAASKAEQQYLQALQQAQGSLKEDEAKGLQGYNPYQIGGYGAQTTLSSLLGTPGQGLLTPWTQQFTAPTEAEAEQTPSYQFQLHTGEDAMQNSAAGRGSLLTGRTLADLNNFAQGTASTNYQNVFNNALTQYNSAYQSFLNNQNDTYARLMGQAGMGLGATENANSFRANMGGDIASLYGQMGAARAQGTMAQANAYSSILPGITNAIGSGLTLGSLLGNGGGGSQTSTFDPYAWIGTPSYMPSTPNYGTPSFPGFDPNGNGTLPISALMGNYRTATMPQV